MARWSASRCCGADALSASARASMPSARSHSPWLTVPSQRQSRDWAIRASGLGLGYTTATAVFGGLTPWAAQWLVERTGSPQVPGIMIAVVALAALPVFVKLRETRPNP